MNLKNVQLESITIPLDYKEVILERRELTPELKKQNFCGGVWGKDRKYNFFLLYDGYEPFKLRIIEDDVESSAVGELKYQLEIDTNHALFKPLTLQKYIREHAAGKKSKKFNQKLGAWLIAEIEKLSGVEVYDELYVQTPENGEEILFIVNDEKVYHQLLVDVSTALRSLEAMAEQSQATVSAAAAKRTFEFNDDKSSKFWSIEVNGSEFTVNYGKVGTAGQSQTKTFANEAACTKEANKLVAEKTKKGYVETDGSAVAVKPKAGGLKIPKYKEHEEADLECNQYVVNLKKPESIAAALKHQLDNVDDFLERFDETASGGDPGVSFGAIVDDEFVPFSEQDKYTNKNLYYDEEILAETIASFPELYPLTAQYITTVVLPASENETASGPWATEETIFGQFLIPMLAERDPQYKPLLTQFVETNVEIRYSPRFQNMFAYVTNEQ